jgi:STIP1 family protein 1
MPDNTTDKTNHRIHYDPGNPILYTNRAMSLLSLSKNAAAAQSPSTNMPLSPIHVENYEQVIADCLTSIRLVAENMKAYYFLAQAQIALHQCSSAVSSAKEAHRLCVEDVHKGGKGASSIGPITELVLRCKKEEWEVREKERLQRRNGLVGELEGLLQNEREARFKDLEHKAAMGLLDAEKFEGESKKLEDEFEKKVDDVRRMALAAGIAGEDAKKRTVPDWCLDDITFSVMVDPVVVRWPLPFPLLQLEHSSDLTIFNSDQNRTVV